MENARMVMLPTYSFKDFQDLVEQSAPYPFYCVLLYTPLNGLDQRLHAYVTSHWRFLNRLTGDNCLVFALEDTDRGITIDQFTPEDVYTIARALGVEVRDLPCMVFFTDPQNRNDTLAVRLSALLPKPNQLTDDDLSTFFKDVQTIVDTCSPEDVSTGLQCLWQGLERGWPQGRPWSEQMANAGKGF